MSDLFGPIREKIEHFFYEWFGVGLPDHKTSARFSRKAPMLSYIAYLSHGYGGYKPLFGFGNPATG
jgi:hypothetical protein